MKIVLEILFLALSNTNIEFIKLEKLSWRFYIAAKALSTNSRIELINKREFTRTALDENFETFVIYVTTLKVPIAILFIS